MKFRHLKLALTIFTFIASLGLLFLTTVLGRLYSTDENRSFENFHRYVSMRDFIYYSVIGLGFLLTIWTFVIYKRHKYVSLFDIVSSVFFLLVAGIIIFFKIIGPLPTMIG